MKSFRGVQAHKTINKQLVLNPLEYTQQHMLSEY